MPEIWIAPDGLPAELTLTSIAPAEVDPETGLDDEWFPDAPGARPPVAYEMRVGPIVVWERVVFPYDPWSPYDTVSDVLCHEGWTPPPPTEAELAECEHGMSARYCSGPAHY